MQCAVVPGIRNERTFRLISYSHTKMEHTIIILGREDKIVLAILLHYIIVPHLLLSPWHILYIENHAMIGYLWSGVMLSSTATRG